MQHLAFKILLSLTDHSRVVDRQGLEVLQEGHRGELQVRGPSVINGYSRCPIETVEAFGEGWLKTGDYGYVRASQIYIVGRIKVKFYGLG